jgi:hypothetical protein
MSSAMNSTNNEQASVEMKLGYSYAKLLEKTQSLTHVTHVDKSELMLANMMQEAVLRITQLNMQQWLAGQ